jgi:hypothetical protein
MAVKLSRTLRGGRKVDRVQEDEIGAAYTTHRIIECMQGFGNKAFGIPRRRWENSTRMEGGKV